jgi:Xaa-Pro dipeptidase
VFIEIAATVERYQTPMMRVASLGPPPAQLRTLADAAVDSVNTLLQTIRPGVASHVPADAAAKCLKHFDARIVWHGLYGYSVGLGFPPEWSDCPSLLIRQGDTQPIEAGMVFHCSTSLRDVGNVGATCSETVLVTDSGCESLTAQQRGLTVIT